MFAVCLIGVAFVSLVVGLVCLLENLRLRTRLRSFGDTDAFLGPSPFWSVLAWLLLCGFGLGAVLASVGTR